MAIMLPPQEGTNLLYAEGFLGPGANYAIHIHHASISLNGKIIDTTARKDRQRAIGTVPEGWQY